MTVIQDSVDNPSSMTTLPKIQQAQAWRAEGTLLSHRVDGGVDSRLQSHVPEAGADTFISGTTLFRQHSLPGPSRSCARSLNALHEATCSLRTLPVTRNPLKWQRSNSGQTAGGGHSGGFHFRHVERVAQAARISGAPTLWGHIQANHRRYDRRFLADAFAQRAAEVLAGNDFLVVLTPEPTPTLSVSWAVKAQKAWGVS